MTGAIEGRGSDERGGSPYPQAIGGVVLLVIVLGFVFGAS